MVVARNRVRSLASTRRWRVRPAHSFAKRIFERTQKGGKKLLLLLTLFR